MFAVCRLLYLPFVVAACCSCLLAVLMLLLLVVYLGVCRWWWLLAVVVVECGCLLLFVGVGCCLSVVALVMFAVRRVLILSLVAAV